MSELCDDGGTENVRCGYTQQEMRLGDMETAGCIDKNEERDRSAGSLSFTIGDFEEIMIQLDTDDLSINILGGFIGYKGKAYEFLISVEKPPKLLSLSRDGGIILDTRIEKYKLVMEFMERAVPLIADHIRVSRIG